MLTLSQRLKMSAAHMQRGWQRKLATACGITAASVNNWVTGKSKNIEYDHAIKAAHFLGVDALWLRTGEGEQNQNPPAAYHRVNEGKNFYGGGNGGDIEGAMEVIRIALVEVDELTRAQAKPIIDALFANPEDSHHLGQRMALTLRSAPAATEKRKAA